MQRCLELARKGAGQVAPNPMVGAVLVNKDRIIGEGYHQHYGGPHAEVNCIRQANEADHGALFQQSVLYVCLEPCAHVGKTPPCADLIIANQIPKVVIGCLDPFEEVNGKGMVKLKAAGVEVELGIGENECKELNKQFFTFHLRHRPYIVLKWAQSANGKIANEDHSRVFVSNEFTNRLVHKWRTEEASILVGTNTALFDDPKLTNRWWPASNPVRLVIDKDLRLPSSLKLFNQQEYTIVFNAIRQEEKEKLLYYQVSEEGGQLQQIMYALHKLNIQSVLVEGGAKLLQSFIDANLWDEARVITNYELQLATGLSSPQLPEKIEIRKKEVILSDHIYYYRNLKSDPDSYRD